MYFHDIQQHRRISEAYLFQLPTDALNISDRCDNFI